eukprot:scaffold35115_cov57-Phaeocystis_antarctica.AAC.4
MRSALALVATAGVVLGLEVHEPAHAAGVYAETRAAFSPRGYHISGPVSVVEACPCDWLSTADYGSGYGPGSFVGLILAVPGDACTGCSPVEAACAAKRACERQEAYDCSKAGLLLPDGFGKDAGDSAAAAASTCMGPNGVDGRTPLPTAFISANASAALVNGTMCCGGSTLNATMADPEGEVFDCVVLENVPWIYLGFVPVWLAAAVLWVMNNRRHAEHTRELHWRLALLPLIGLAQALLSVIFYAQCPWEATPLMVALTLCWVLASIVKEPVVILCFVLVAKGWGITRDELSRCDTYRIGACISAMFVSMAVQMAVETHFAVLATVALYLILCLEVSTSIKTNLLVLKAQLCALRQFNVDPRSTPAYHKYCMFRRLSWLATGYVLVELGLHLSFEFTDRYGKVWWPFMLGHQASELFFALFIGYTFRATPRNVLFQRVQAQVAELAERLLPQITTVEIGPDLLGEGDTHLLPWRQDMQLANVNVNALPQDAQAEPPPRFLVVNPGDSSWSATPGPTPDPGSGRQEVELQPTPGWSATPTTTTAPGAASAAASVDSGTASKM